MRKKSTENKFLAEGRWYFSRSHKIMLAFYAVVRRLRYPKQIPIYGTQFSKHRNLSATVLMFCVFSCNAQVVAVYGPVSKLDFQRAAEAFKRVKLLEQMAEVINRTIRVPIQIPLAARECGTVNAYYSSRDRAVYICYEMLEQIIKGVTRDFGNTPENKKMDAAFGAIFFILHHELGHALIDVLRVPVLGKEEDAADAIATYLMLRMPDSYSAILGTLWFFGQGSKEFSMRDFADEHSLGPQRQSSLLCFALGKDPERFESLAKRFALPDERARRCSAENRQLENSVSRLLGNSLRK